jgi:flagellar motor switch protein FliN/FliY
MTDKAREIEFLYDVELELSVILGTARMLIRDLLALTTGSVVELNKLAGESLDVVINDKVIARGEAVVVNEKFGIRLTEVVSPYERIKHLRG